MPVSRHSSNLRGRREALGASTQQIATGLGIDLREVLALEDGASTDDRLNFYVAWLSRLEATTPGRRQQLLQLAIEGTRFN